MHGSLARTTPHDHQLNIDSIPIMNVAAVGTRAPQMIRGMTRLAHTWNVLGLKTAQ